MAISSAQIKNLRESQSQNLEANEIKSKKNNPIVLMQKAQRYEKHSKYWSILSNIAAIVSVTSAIYAVLRKPSRWF